MGYNYKKGQIRDLKELHGCMNCQPVELTSGQSGSEFSFAEDLQTETAWSFVRYTLVNPILIAELK